MRWVVLAAALSLIAPAAYAAEQAVSAELIRLHDDLHLTGAQENAWRDYTLAIAPTQEAEARRRAAEAMMPSLPAPGRIALMAATMAQDLADFRREGAAVTAFYDQLTPEQQRVFDRETLPQAQGARPAS
jgi:protein CpxP